MKFLTFIICLFSVLSLTAREIIIEEQLIEGFETTMDPNNNTVSPSLDPTEFDNWGVSPNRASLRINYRNFIF